MTWAPAKTPEGRLRRLAEIIGGRMRRSRRGVPHVIVGEPQVRVSIAYFKYPKPGHEHDHKPWAVFWPWPSYGDQERKHLADVREVLEFLGEHGTLDLDDPAWAGWEDFEL